jgi:hypothetical protein
MVFVSVFPVFIPVQQKKMKTKTFQVFSWPFSVNLSKCTLPFNLCFLSGYCLWTRGFGLRFQFSSQENLWGVTVEPFESHFHLLSNVLTFTLQILWSYKVGCDLPGKYGVALDSDALVFGGHGRVSNIARCCKNVPFINGDHQNCIRISCLQD